MSRLSGANRTRAPAGNDGAEGISRQIMNRDEFDLGLRLSRQVRGCGELVSVAESPDIGVADIPLLDDRGNIASAYVNDRNIAENANSHILHREAADRHR